VESVVLEILVAVGLQDVDQLAHEGVVELESLVLIESDNHHLCKELLVKHPGCLIQEFGYLEEYKVLMVVVCDHLPILCCHQNLLELHSTPWAVAVMADLKKKTTMKQKEFHLKFQSSSRVARRPLELPKSSSHLHRPTLEVVEEEVEEVVVEKE
jgi:hypothetical protein